MANEYAFKERLWLTIGIVFLMMLILFLFIINSFNKENELEGELASVIGEDICEFADFNDDGFINEMDEDAFYNSIGFTGCSDSNDNCNKMDIDKDREVSYLDLRYFIDAGCFGNN